MKKKLIYILLVTVIFSCKKEVIIEPGKDNADWTEATHGSLATPNYSKIFTDSKVHRLDIVLDAGSWEAMQDDLEDLLGSSSSGGGPGGGGPGGGGAETSTENPIYVPCHVFYEGTQWYDVGIRYKGNSSLSSAFQQGSGKLPFRLEFNHFETENPTIWGQTFYGFQQLTFSSGFKDESLLREKITPDLFREFGVPAARTAFYRVYVDYGDGPVYFGLYTMVEVIFDTMINEQFSGSNGNCYKPDADAAYLNDVSTINSIDMPNKINEGVTTEITNLINALNGSDRTSNPSQWRSNLETVIDMDQYLKYLAANTTLANWDTYGMMTHNYYLYANPADGRLNWIPWDNNESLTTTGSKDPLDFDFGNISTGTWPMLNYIYSDAIYKAQYDQYIDDFIQTVFTVSNVQSKVNNYSNLIQDYVTGANGEQSGYTFTTSAGFSTAVSDLNAYANTRWNEADAYTP
jgi:spore coat protein H